MPSIIESFAQHNADLENAAGHSSHVEHGVGIVQHAKEAVLFPVFNAMQDAMHKMESNAYAIGLTDKAPTPALHAEPSPAFDQVVPDAPAPQAADKQAAAEPQQQKAAAQEQGMEMG